MTRRKPSRWLAPPCDRGRVDEQAEACAAGMQFAAGMRVGVSIATRVAAGDVDLIEHLRRIVGDDGPIDER